MPVDTDVPHAGSQSDNWLSNAANECGCNFNSKGFENLTTSGSVSAGPFQIRSADQILVRHKPCHSGNCGITEQSEKLKIMTMWLFESSRKSTKVSSFPSQTCHFAELPKFHSFRKRMSSL